MADIFVSYCKTDRRLVERIVALLEHEGWSVWWDTRIGSGEQWDAVIEREIAAARCVVAVWTEDAVKSRWVKTEASEGLERGILVPVVIGNVIPPLAFKLIQWTDLSAWAGHAHDPLATRLVADVHRVAGAPEDVPSPALSASLNGPATNSKSSDRANTPAGKEPVETAQVAFIGSRSQQQDAVGVRPLGDSIAKLLVVADGYGDEGVRISNVAVAGFRRAADSGAFDNARTRGRALKEVLLSVNQSIRDLAESSRVSGRTGTTLVAAVVGQSSLQWVSVGSSHLLLYRFPDLIKLNQDHSKLGTVVASTAHSEDEPEPIGSRKLLLSMLDGYNVASVDLRSEPLALLPRDVVILATDGLDSLSGDEIADEAFRSRSAGPQGIANALIEAVQSKNVERQDNVAIVVAEIGSAETGHARAGSTVSRMLRSRGFRTHGIARQGRRRIWPIVVAAIALVAAALCMLLLR